MAKFAWVFFSLVVLAGCGGGGGGGSAPVAGEPAAPPSGGIETPADGGDEPVIGGTPIGGKVIDGYISGAAVFLDLNLNGEHDSDEPRVETGSGGNFRFDLSDDQLQCASYVPMVVNVPVGAMDEELGPVTEAYRMVLPPRNRPLTTSSELNITPLTSMVWRSVESQLDWKSNDLSCASLAADAGKRAAIQSILESAIGDLVAHYNLSEAQIFSDFIAADDTAAKAAAVKIVKGLQKSLVETARLRAANSTAIWASVNYFFFSAIDGDERYPDAWYRETQLYVGDSITKELVKVSDDLSTELRPILYEKTTVSELNGLTVREEIGYESRGGDDSPYSCSYKESAAFMQAGVEYELYNLGGEDDVTDVSRCQLPNFSTDASSRYLFYKKIEAGITSGAQFTFMARSGAFPAFPALNNWTNIVGNADDLDRSELVDYVESLPYGFCLSGSAGASGVVRSRTQRVGTDTVTLNRYENGAYERITAHADGTKTTETAATDTAVGWDDCANNDADEDGSPDAIDPDDDNDGVPDSEDAFPFNPWETLDTDGDGVGNNSDDDDDGDGLADINDEFPLDAGNVVDSDGDGVVDRDDVAPNNATVSAAMRVDFSEASALGLGSVVERDTIPVATIKGLGLEQRTALLPTLVGLLFADAIADGVTLESLTNAIGWNDDGDLVADTILSNTTKFVAEAALSPDGRFLYLLTSGHLQRALVGVDPEYCSMYRVALADSSFTCLLTLAEGDIQPRSLNSGLRFDNSRGGMVFRSDGAALVHGFNWQRLNATPEPCECASGSVWFMAPDGTLTDLPRDVGWEATTAVWLNDGHFAVPEHKIGEGSRIVVYDADTFDRERFIGETDANGANISLLKVGGELLWSNRRMDTGTLEITPSPQGGFPVVDQSGERLFFFAWTELLNTDGTLQLDLVADGASSYNWQEQSGIGTDIKYTPLAFGETHLAFMKVYPPTTPIQTIEGAEFTGEATVLLSGERGSLKLEGMNVILITPGTGLTGDLILDYTVDNNSSIEARQLTIPAEVFARWRADPDAESHIHWALPESEIEGICLYAYATEALQCTTLDDYEVLAFDMESSRSTRYDDDAVCPGGSCNAFPGVSNVVLIQNMLRVYFKDSRDHTYYEARAKLADFMAEGEPALTYSPAVNGAGEVNIIAAATRLAPFDPRRLVGASVTANSKNEYLIDFGQPLSQYAEPPVIEAWNGAAVVPLAREVEWSSDRSTATVTLTSVGLIGGEEHQFRLKTPMFVVDSNLQYEFAEPLTFTPVGVNGFQLSEVSPRLRDYNPATGNDELRTLPISWAGGVLSLDIASQPLNLENMENAAAEGDFKTPTIELTLASLPVGAGSADVVVDVFDGSDAARGAGERHVRLEFTIDWASDGAVASLSVPVQTVDAAYVTSVGSLVELGVNNADVDLLTVDSNGPNYPNTLNLKLLSVINKLPFDSPGSLLRAGDYFVRVTTTLPLADSLTRDITAIEASLSIGD